MEYMIKLHSNFKKNYKYYLCYYYAEEGVLMEGVSVKMYHRNGGMVGEFGWGLTPGDGGHPLNVEVLAVGPAYQEMDYRWLSADTFKAPFYRHDPYPPLLFMGEHRAMLYFC